ncbi:helix-turn-helix transcriptional regulator [Castellaniella sp.]|uniref:helix-turn-helix domain-containing protein n=1 Tax=Castellaniella sp. TaxID=1955812 RepID=UPI002AFECB93|nr:helix-turn-helix transcriptional regulator [Castellaniella sp.]
MGKKIVDELSRTLKRVTGHGTRYPQLEVIASRTGVSKSTIARARTGETALKIDNLEDLAKAFGMEAWQLLVPGVEPDKPPILVDSPEVAATTAWPFADIVSLEEYRSLPVEDQMAIREYIEMKVHKHASKTFRPDKAG